MRRASPIAVACAVSLWFFAGPAGAQEGGAEVETARVVLEGRTDPEGGAVVRVDVIGGAVGAARLAVRCRDGETTLVEATGAAPLSVTIEGGDAAFNATCEAEAEGAGGGGGGGGAELELRAARSVTVAAAPEAEGGDAGWVFGVALGVTLAAAVAIVVSMIVASATSPVNVGVPTVEGW